MERRRLERKVWQYVTDMTQTWKFTEHPSEMIFYLHCREAFKILALWKKTLHKWTQIVATGSEGDTANEQGDTSAHCFGNSLRVSLWPLMVSLVCYYSALCFPLRAAKAFSEKEVYDSVHRESYTGEKRSRRDQTGHCYTFRSCPPGGLPASEVLRVNSEQTRRRTWLAASILHQYLCICLSSIVFEVLLYAQTGYGGLDWSSSLYNLHKALSLCSLSILSNATSERTWKKPLFKAKMLLDLITQ